MQKLRWKRKIATIWPQSRTSKKIILLYHSVGKTPWATSSEEFDLQMSWLVNNCSLLSLTELIHAPFNNKIQVALTFDDGYRSLYETVLPILLKRKMSGMVYLNTGWIGDGSNERKKSVVELGHYPDESFLTWSEVKTLYEQGWEVGSHGVNHLDFTQLGSSLMLQELMESKRTIEEKLNINCDHFSYPWGRYSTLVKRCIKEVGYIYAGSACHGKIDSNTDLYAIPRINIDKDFSFDDFKNIIKGKWDYLKFIHKIKGL